MSVANLRALMAMLHVSAEGGLEKQDMKTRLCESGSSTSQTRNNRGFLSLWFLWGRARGQVASQIG